MQKEPLKEERFKDTQLQSIEIVFSKPESLTKIIKDIEEGSVNPLKDFIHGENKPQLIYNKFSLGNSSQSSYQNRSQQRPRKFNQGSYGNNNRN